MTFGLIFGVAFNAVLFSAVLWHHPRPDYSRFDMRRCYSEVTVLWDGMPEYRQPATRQNSRSRLVCWPRRGVFMAGQGALAWQVAAVKPR